MSVGHKWQQERQQKRRQGPAPAQLGGLAGEPGGLPEANGLPRRPADPGEAAKQNAVGLGQGML